MADIRQEGRSQRSTPQKRLKVHRTRDQLLRRDSRYTGPGAPRNRGGDGEGRSLIAREESVLDKHLVA